MSTLKAKLTALQNLPNPPESSKAMSFFTDVIKKGAKIVEHGRLEAIGKYQVLVQLHTALLIIF